MRAAAKASEQSYVGVVERRGRFTVVERLFERGRRLAVDIRGRSDVGVGDMVLVRAGPRRVGVGRAEIVRSLGRPGIARDVVEALLVERGHQRAFAPAVADAARVTARSGDSHRRRDLTSLPTFTVDPVDARDFDDAVSCEQEGDDLRLHVHIADVAARVAPGTATDREAARRGNSVYVPGAVEPMLPEALSNDTCSLVPGARRCCVTVELKIGQGGRVLSSSFYRSVIRSDAALTYRDVDLIFEGRRPPPEPVAGPLRRARGLAAALRRRRFERGALGVETSEPEFEFDSRGEVTAAADAVQTESHGLIEELMILANEQVAATLERRRLGTLYRVHEPPDPASVEFLAAQLSTLDVPVPSIPEHMTPRQAAELTGAMGAAVLGHVRRTGRACRSLTSLVLRSLKQAHYSARNIGHAGLASRTYCHFTSPIRRYPDLIVHRALMSAVGAGEKPPASQELDEIARHCSETEREAMQVERDADDICLAFLLERELAERGWECDWEGEVSGLIDAGMFVGLEVGGAGAVCEGFLPVRKLRDDFFDLNEEGTALVGRHGGRHVRLGDPISVVVRSVDPPRGRIDLAPAGEEPHARSRRGQRRGGRRAARSGAGRTRRL